MKKISLLAIAFILTGCSAWNSVTGNAYAPKTAEFVISNAKDTPDIFNKNNKVTFPTYNLRHFTNYKEVTGMSMWFAPDTQILPYAAYTEKTCNAYIFMSINRSEWAFYESAKDDEGNTLTFISDDQRIDTNKAKLIVEDFRVKLPSGFLTKNKGRNPRIKIFGKRDNFVIFLPDYYIEGMLQYFADNNINCK